MAQPVSSLREEALSILRECDPVIKVRRTVDLAGALVDVDCETHFAEPTDVPGRPTRPSLVAPKKVPKRSMGTPAGRATLIHAICHIEFNAINLSLDACFRFAGMPEQYYRDWFRVAQEEAYHFTLLREHLTTLGYEYGDFSAHNSLWEMVEKTKHDVVARMALVPRTLEARGLDASLPMKAKLVQVGDHAAAAIIDIVLRDEIGHVAIGNHWYRWLCNDRGLDVHRTYAVLAVQYKAPVLRGPFNFEARRRAGFDEREIADLQDLISTNEKLASKHKVSS